MHYHIVQYAGPFGFIKPWTAVRDQETFSQQFLAPATLEGIEKKLFPESAVYGQLLKIKRYRLNYQGISVQQERTWSKGGFNATREKGIYKTNVAIINRGVLINPHLYLAFENEEDAQVAAVQTICLCRNEDLLLPESAFTLSDVAFDEIPGFELIPASAETGFKVGHNRFDRATEMFGELKIFGNPIRN